MTYKRLRNRKWMALERFYFLCIVQNLLLVGIGTELGASQENGTENDLTLDFYRFCRISASVDLEVCVSEP